MDWMKLVHGTAAAPPAKFKTGDEVRVWFKILEQGKERLGQFEGLVIRTRGSGYSKTFTVRRVTHGEGVERVFPFDSKTISRIEVLRPGQVKRSRLYYLRAVIGKTRIAAGEAMEEKRAAPEGAAAGKGADGDPLTLKPQGDEAAEAAAAAERAIRKG